MSLDYPSREEWLAVRSLAPRPPRYVYVSTGPGMPSRTWVTGATQRKAIRWVRKQANQRLRRQLKQNSRSMQYV